MTLVSESLRKIGFDADAPGEAGTDIAQVELVRRSTAARM